MLVPVLLVVSDGVCLGFLGWRFVRSRLTSPAGQYKQVVSVIQTSLLLLLLLLLSPPLTVSMVAALAGTPVLQLSIFFAVSTLTGFELRGLLGGFFFSLLLGMVAGFAVVRGRLARVALLGHAEIQTRSKRLHTSSPPPPFTQQLLRGYCFLGPPINRLLKIAQQPPNNNVWVKQQPSPPERVRSKCLLPPCTRA